jgi:hypothetical protein
MARVLYADFSPGYAWDGREPEALEVATATQLTPRTVTSFAAAGLEALAAAPRPVAFLVEGATPAHAPAYVDIAGFVADVAATERVYLPATSAGMRTRGAVCGLKAFADTDLTITFPAGSGIGATIAIGLGLIPGVSDLRVAVPIETWLEGFRDRRLAYPHLDVAAINEVVVPSSWKIDGALATPNGNYDVPFDLIRLGDVGRIARTYALASAGSLRPGVFQIDFVAYEKTAQADLDRLRKALASVGTAPPDPAANVGGNTGTIGVACIVPPKSFTSSLGDFA